jgi:hypothetical protein
MFTRSSIAIVLLGLGAPGLTWAAFWDLDTLAVEAARRPAIAAIVQGKLPRHSRLYYEEQVRYTEPLLDPGGVGSGADPRRFDDLATAYQRLGRKNEAIDVLKEKRGRFGPSLANRLRLALLQSEAPEPQGTDRERELLTRLARVAAEPALAPREDLLGLPPVSAEHPVPDSHAPVPADAVDVMEALGTLIASDWSDNRHLWFVLGRVLAHAGDNRLALRAFQRADQLGHPGALQEFCETAKRFKEYALRGYYCPAVRDAIQREWTAGASSTDRNIAREDALLRAGKRRTVFGY